VNNAIELSEQFRFFSSPLPGDAFDAVKRGCWSRINAHKHLQGSKKPLDVRWLMQKNYFEFMDCQWNVN
jgi:hypothetical protein